MKSIFTNIKPLKILLKLLLLLVVISLAYLLYLRLVPINDSAFIRQQNNLAQQHPKLYLPAQQQWVDLDDISPNLVLAVIASEDQVFLQHFGFDFVQILTAIRDYGRGKKLRGASTITQQLVKNMFLWSNGDKKLRKLLEVMIVPLVELCWSKSRIVEVYLNIIQFDDITYGVQLASLKYFNKSAKNISRSEAAWLVAAVTEPTKYSINNPSKQLIKRQANILVQMNIMQRSGLLRSLNLK